MPHSLVDPSRGVEGLLDLHFQRLHAVEFANRVFEHAIRSAVSNVMDALQSRSRLQLGSVSSLFVR